MKSRRSKNSRNKSRKRGGKTEGDNIYNCERHWMDWVNENYPCKSCRELNDYDHIDFPGDDRAALGDKPRKQQEGFK